MKRFTVFLCAVMMIPLMSIGYPAEASLMNFDATSLGTFLTADYIEDGIKMTSISGHYDFLDLAGTGGTNYLNIDTTDTGPVSQVKFELVSGDVFDLLGLDVIDENGLDGVLESSAGGSKDLSSAGPTTFSGSDWTMLSWLTFTVEDSGTDTVEDSGTDTVHDSGTDVTQWAGIDTLELSSSSVPEPATMLLIGTGLLGLVGLGRRKFRS